MSRLTVRDRIIYEGLTFNDVLLVPARSKILPKDVNLKTKLTQKLSLNIPFVSAAMDTVTEHKLAIALARQGGIGIIHKNLSPVLQADEVSMVKRSQSGKITNPKTLGPDNTLEDAQALMEKYKFSSVPIVQAGKLVGLVTKSDCEMWIEERKKPIKDFMKPLELLITRGPEITMDEALRVMRGDRVKRLPLVDPTGILAGLYTIKDIIKKVKYPNAAIDEKDRLLVGAAIGVGPDLMERTELLVNAGADILCMDSSHGHSLGVLSAIEQVKSKYPEVPIIGGNVCTADGAKDLISAGVDVVKVGVGPGSICTTRVVNGCGMPQITATSNCVEVACEKGIPVIADGGIQYSGDVTKALAAGADCVMIGSLFAGTEESPGETVLIDGKYCKSYRGMGSEAAMKKGSDTRYGQAGQLKYVPEGVEAAVSFKGPLAGVTFDLLGGLRSGMGMLGAENIPMLWQAKFVRITDAGVTESHPHGVLITKENSNYPGRM